jgi:hypothetical protein
VVSPGLLPGIVLVESGGSPCAGLFTLPPELEELELDEFCAWLGSWFWATKTGWLVFCAAAV